MSDDRPKRIDLDELERKARAATQGLRTVDDPADPQDVLDEERGKLIVRCHRAPIQDNTRFIAAASPPVVLALIARIRELEAGLHEAIDGWDDCDRGRSAEDAALRRQVGDVLAKGAVLP